MWNHWVARTNMPHAPLLEFQIAQNIWKGFTHHFPDLLAAVLMPNHYHLILPASQTTLKVSQQLGGMMSGVSKRRGVMQLWQPLPPPNPIPDLHHLKRQIRYVALNPCRKGLCKDPLEWTWSTYRDIMGATVHDQSASVLSKILGENAQRFQVRFHAYVSGDPSVQIQGTPLPQPAMPQKWASESIGDILTAAASALRMHPNQVRQRGELRTLFIHMAYRHGWDHASLLTQICQISRSTVHQIRKQRPPLGLKAADLCLGDVRLRHDALKLHRMSNWEPIVPHHRLSVGHSVKF